MKPFYNDEEDEITGSQYDELLEGAEPKMSIKEEIDQEATDLAMSDDNVEDEVNASEDAMAEVPETIIPTRELAQSAPQLSPSINLDDRLKKLEQLMSARRQEQQRLAMLAAANNIGQSLAGKYSGKFKADNEVIEQMAKNADLPVKDAQAILEEYRKLRKAETPIGAGASKRFQLTTTVNPEGKVVQAFFDTQTGQIVPTDIVRGFATQIRQDPRSKEVIGIQPGTAQIVGQLTQPKLKMEPGVTKTSDVYKTFTPKQQEDISKLQNTFAQETKEPRSFLDEVSGAKSMVMEATKNPNTAKGLGGVVARLIEGGRLTDDDTKRYVGQAGLINQAKDSIALLATGTITTQQAKNLQKTLDLLTRTSKMKLQERALEKAKTMADKYEGYTPEDLAPMLYGDFQSKVKMRDKKGKVGLVPAAKVIDAVKQGYEVVD